MREAKRGGLALTEVDALIPRRHSQRRPTVVTHRFAISLTRHSTDRSLQDALSREHLVSADDDEVLLRPTAGDEDGMYQTVFSLGDDFRELACGEVFSGIHPCSPLRFTARVYSKTISNAIGNKYHLHKSIRQDV